MGGPDPRGRVQALGRARRRHPDVDDGGVRRGAGDQLQQPVGVAGLPDDLDAGRRERAGERLPEQDRVVGEDYAHGISARMTVPAPGSLVTARRAADRRHPILETAKTGAARRIGATDAVVGDLDEQDAIPPLDRQPDARRLRVLDDVREGLRDDEVGGRLDVLGESARPGSNGDRHGRSIGEGLDGGRQP